MAKTVYVALSGGVDSSVAAALLMKQGYRVVGIFMKTYEGDPKLGYCPWEEDQKMVGKVAKHLKIPWKTWNFSRKYEVKVLGPFFKSYERGLTPNPDTFCNREIKFGEFLRRALLEGADFIATGHYARVIRINSHDSDSSRFALAIPKDRHKDQTYFLYQLNQEQLERSLFPLGCYTKAQVRQLAKKMGLPNADRPDSQGICFVGEVPIREFLGHRLPKKRGPIVSTSGEKIGTHDGIWFFTIGQRHGLQVGGLPGQGGIPYYVVDKDVEGNTLFVSPGLAPELYQKEMEVEEVNWVIEDTKVIKDIQDIEGARVLVRFRHGQDLQSARLHLTHSISSVGVVFDSPQRAIAPGQAAVFYQGDRLLGGGVILKTKKVAGYEATQTQQLLRVTKSA